MDMLAGYGSDEESDDTGLLGNGPQGPDMEAVHSRLMPNANPPATNSLRGRPVSAGLPADFFDARGDIDTAPVGGTELDGPDVGPAIPTEILRRKKGGADIEDMPAPSGALLAKLPAPSKRVVKLPFKSKLLAGLASQRAAQLGPDVEEDARPVKRPKPSTATKLTEFLPPPKFDRTSALGGGGVSARSKRTAGSDSEDELDGVTAAGIGFSFSNEPYKPDEGEGDIEAQGLGDAPGPASLPPNRASGGASSSHAAAAYAYQGGTEQGYYAADGQQNAAGSYAAYQGYEGYDASYNTEHGMYGEQQGTDATLAAALREEAERAARRGEPSGSSLKDIKFKEVNAKELKYMDEAQKQSVDALRQALGSEYAMGLRSSATPFVGNKLARRKHQIGTLLYNARMKELEMMEQRAKGMKQKAETQAKYGW